MERGLTVCWLLMALLLAAGATEDSQEPSGSDNEVASGPEDLGPLPPLNNIDPNLRRALLQALTNLEEEAKQHLQDQQPSEEDKDEDNPPESEVTTTTAPLVIRVPDPAPTASTSVDIKREETKKVPEEPPTQKNDGEGEKKKKEEQEVKIFQAPLVAAFTLHHDEQGLPRRVEPLYKPSPSEETASPTAKNFQDQLLVLHHRQVLLKQQQERLEQLQRQRQALLEQREREERQRLLEEQRLRQQLQEQQIRQQLYQQRFVFGQQQQQQQQQFQFQQQPAGHFFGQASRPRHLRQEQGTGNAGAVDFQRSVGFQTSDFQRPNGLDFQRNVANNGVDFQRGVVPNPADFQRGGVPNGGDFQRGLTPNGGDFQRGLSNGGFPNGGDFQRDLTPNRGVDFQRSVGVELQPPPATPFNRELLQQQQLQLLRLNSNTGFQPINSPLQQQPSFSNTFQAAATFTPPFFQAPLNNGFAQRPSPEAQIQNLFFPNFGGSPHEDINIVSKVLSLNHEGKRTNEISRDSQNKKTETA